MHQRGVPRAIWRLGVLPVLQREGARGIYFINLVLCPHMPSSVPSVLPRHRVTHSLQGWKTEVQVRDGESYPFCSLCPCDCICAELELDPAGTKDSLCSAVPN